MLFRPRHPLQNLPLPHLIPINVTCRHTRIGDVIHASWQLIHLLYSHKKKNHLRSQRKNRIFRCILESIRIYVRNMSRSDFFKNLYFSKKVVRNVSGSYSHKEALIIFPIKKRQKLKHKPAVLVPFVINLNCT